MKRSHIVLLALGTLLLSTLIMWTSSRAISALGGRNRTIETAYGPQGTATSWFAPNADPTTHTSRVNVGRVLHFRSVDQGDMQVWDAKQAAPINTARAERGLYVLTTQPQVDALDQRVIGADAQFYDQRLRFVDALRHVKYNRDFVIVVAGGRGPGTELDVHLITQRNDQVLVFAEVMHGQTQGTQPAPTGEPYQAVALSREGLTGEPVQFLLMIDGKAVTTTTATLH